ncbi:MAG: PQQ-binding-like beta-propeller repeat protein [Planctomycetales bacterium]|nr:PQQ-binding-like beta-propeller repeat protein [Planctomycetales bacterium]
MSRRALFATSLALLASGLLHSSHVSGEQPWTQWRGPHGDGHSDAPALLRWNDENVTWKTALPGLGQSSPVVWGDRIFLTGAENDGAKRIVFCVSRKNGKLLWQQTAWTGDAEKTHQMNRWASATCATDGERVVAFFGRGGLHCYSMDGTRLWSRELGDFENVWGTAASPIIAGELVIQNCDAEDSGSCLVALNKETGAEVWRTAREQLRGWSTPVVVANGDKQELVLNGETGVFGYDLASGAQLWFSKGDTGRGTPTVTPTGDGLLVVVNGRPGDMFAVQADGKEVWRTKRKGGRDLPSPIVLDGQVIVVSLRPGTATSYIASSGKETARLRLDGSFSASPIAVSGHAIIPNEDGLVYVLKAGDQGVEVVSKNKITLRAENEIFRACVTPLEDGLLLRSDQTLYLIQ